jgi:hypothetical protein
MPKYKHNVYKNLPLAAMSDLQRENKEIVAIGLDTLQLPRCKITFKF